MFPTCSKTHEAAFFTKNDKKMIKKKDKNTLPPLKSVSILGGGGRGLIITQRLPSPPPTFDSLEMSFCGARDVILGL